MGFSSAAPNWFDRCPYVRDKGLVDNNNKKERFRMSKRFIKSAVNGHRFTKVYKTQMANNFVQNL